MNDVMRQNARHRGQCPCAGSNTSESSRLMCMTHRFHAQVAIKRVLQDPRYRNRELSIMKQLDHPNIVPLKHYYHAKTPPGHVSGPDARDEVPCMHTHMLAMRCLACTRICPR